MSGTHGVKKRLWRNYLLAPNLQIRIGIYFVIISLLFVIVGSFVLYHELADLFQLIVNLTGVETEVMEVVGTYLRDVKWQGYLMAGAFVVINTGASIFFTHRLVGPTIAFRRHVERLIEGDFKSRIRLRNGDAFADVADVLNRLAEKMEEQGKIA
jgi:methyl-accepting chemotaxis protein